MILKIIFVFYFTFLGLHSAELPEQFRNTMHYQEVLAKKTSWGCNLLVAMTSEDKKRGYEQAFTALQNRLVSIADPADADVVALLTGQSDPHKREYTNIVRSLVKFAGWCSDAQDVLLHNACSYDNLLHYVNITYGFSHNDSAKRNLKLAKARLMRLKLESEMVVTGQSYEEADADNKTRFAIYRLLNSIRDGAKVRLIEQAQLISVCGYSPYRNRGRDLRHAKRFMDEYFGVVPRARSQYDRLGSPRMRHVRVVSDMPAVDEDGDIETVPVLPVVQMPYVPAVPIPYVVDVDERERAAETQRKINAELVELGAKEFHVVTPPVHAAEVDSMADEVGEEDLTSVVRGLGNFLPTVTPPKSTTKKTKRVEESSKQSRKNRRTGSSDDEEEEYAGRGYGGGSSGGAYMERHEEDDDGDVGYDDAVSGSSDDEDGSDAEDDDEPLASVKFNEKQQRVLDALEANKSENLPHRTIATIAGTDVTAEYVKRFVYDHARQYSKYKKSALPPLTAAQKAEIERLLSAGSKMRHEDVAAAVKCTEKQVTKYITNHAKHLRAYTKAAPRLTGTQKDRIEELLQANPKMAYADVASDVGCKVTQVSKYVDTHAKHFKKRIHDSYARRSAAEIAESDEKIKALINRNKSINNPTICSTIGIGTGELSAFYKRYPKYKRKNRN